MNRLGHLLQTKRWVGLFLIPLTISSCNVLYHPTTHNSPLLRNQGELQVTGMLASNNLELHTAYGITNHLGVMLNASYLNRTREVQRGEELVKFNESWGLLEGGLGYYTRVAQIVAFEVYGGAGFGTVPGDLRGVNYVYDGSQITDIKKLFIQPAIGVGSRLIDASLVGRFSAIQINNETEIFTEPGVVIKVGYNRFRFVASTGISLPLINKISDLSWENDMVMFGIGLQYTIGRK